MRPRRAGPGVGGSETLDEKEVAFFRRVLYIPIIFNLDSPLNPGRMIMELIYFSAFVSFVLGATSYIIVRYWVLPIGRYQTRKKAVDGLLPRYREIRAETASRGPDNPAAAECARSLRKQATLLTESFDLDLPHWYRMLLDSRKESPTEAARLLMTLANTRHIDHIDQQIENIRAALRLG